MNSIIILIISLAWIFLGYYYYGRFIKKKLKINDKNKTPAHVYSDKVDYSPAKKEFLMGHHFASIAGAGPIIGPILAVNYFGWLPVVIWVLLGVVFIGAMHDYTSLIASVRNKGKSVAVIAKNYLNSCSGWIFGLMIWITLVLIITVFSVSAAESIIAKPDLVIPLLTITFLAIILGAGTKKYKWNYKISSLIALILIFFSVWVGNKIPLEFGIANQSLLRIIWVTIIMAYAFAASTIPVWLLLRPRDYLSAIQMGLILLLGIISIFIVRPIISAPAYITSAGFPIWPVLFITVACGAISGFHGLVASGTTSKQLDKESHGKSVGYGGMLMEGLLAIFVTLVVVAGLNWSGSVGSFQGLFNQGWIILFSSGFGNIVGKLGIPGISISIAGLLGAFMVNQFILTSVDTSTRLGRFIVSESLIPKLKNRYVLSLITLIPAWFLAATNTYDTLWKMFGTSNQLIAAISLITLSTFFVAKKIKVKFIIIPALFILVTTLCSLIYLAFFPGGFLSQNNLALVIISSLMFILGIIVAAEGFSILKKKK